ncbi:MAG: GxxExxY protein [Anaerolineae bacterium UTCFX3]|jgi:GxxExxY protein|nr:MAG: GxxExxY protein [Anaerolineae bacterium UTCFX3]
MTNPPKKIYLPVDYEVEKIGKVVLDTAYKVHTALGPGLLESAYQTAVKYVIEKGGVLVETEVKLPIMFDGLKIESAFRLDMLVAKCVIVEFKAVETMHPIYETQIMTYLRLSGLRLGFLINFNVRHLKDGIKRIVV